jgi:hypothetical protein
MKNQTQSQSMSAPTGKLVRFGDGASITVFMNGESLKLTEDESKVNFDAALEALRNEDWDTLYTVMRPVKAYASKIDAIEVNEKGVFFNGDPIHNTVATRILDFARKGLDHKPLCAFLNKLLLNPSKRAVDELYTFLEHQFLPITDNGNILAYKGVRSDWYSMTRGNSKLLKGKSVDGRIYNGIGEEIEMERRDVDDDKDKACSYGLHAGSLKYASDFGRGGRLLILEINPKDVVSIPVDENAQKMRTCAYKVVGEYTKPLDEPLYESNWKPSSDVDNIGDNYDTDRIPDIEIYPDDSSWIESVLYYAEDSELVISTHDGRKIVHLDVPYNVADYFRSCVSEGKSAGQFYHTNIKDDYTVA